ncbi:DUF861 domain-containing protein [Actinoplanes bogorensis]|uniref:DUF861 domain-containing protein n=1 Tax=Paractinoplanes bogorensis TaxID=1610840 RepID=A0ABS5YV50_9ACTN|nr:cupin domain-containing protein [Actinoplanes bogorensis]MBU2667216.1 DUF861 domain-containing protein [Actinoplanes bogorensis]
MSTLPHLDGEHVRKGELPVEISMEPIISGVPFAYEVVVSDDADGFFAVWACDAGVYPRVKDRRGSFMYILEGDATITDQDGTEHVLTADSVIVLPYGWAGQWDIRRTIRKVYLHSTPVAPFRDGVQPSAFLSTEPTLSGGNAVVFDGPDGHCQVHDLPIGDQRVEADGQARFLFVMSGTGSVTGDDGTTRPLTDGDVIALPSGWSGTFTVTSPMRRFDVRTTPATV